MKNMRIINKLLVSFGGIAFLVACLTGYAIVRLKTTNDLMDLAIRDRLPKLTTARDITGTSREFRNAEAQHILAATPAEMDAAESRLNDHAAAITRGIQDLDAKLQVASSRERLARFQSGWDAYLATDRTLLALSRQNRKGEAAAFLRGKSQQAYDAYQKSAADLANTVTEIATASADEGDALFKHTWMLLLVATALVMAGLAVVLVNLVKQVAKPVAAVADAIGQLARGRMDVAVPVEDRADEVGALATAMKGLRDQLAAAEEAKATQTALIVDSVGTALSKLAEGDLVSRVEADLTGPFAKLKTDFNEAASSLQTTLSQIAEAARAIDGGAGEIRMASDDLSQRTEQQAASLEETAAAMNEITSTVRSTAERAESANAATKSAREEAEHSGQIVRDAVEAMSGIERTSNEISEIISVIDGIAFQTNLLALNAGVEAARAGDAGKGFAVVASEVRALAQRSAEAAKDVKTRITASSEQVAAGVQLVGETGRALDRIIERVGRVNGLVAEIAASAEQQATGLQQINTAVSEMDNVTQQNAAMVEQATAAARSLATEADGMARQIARFRTGGAAAAHASPVHALRDRAATAGRRIAKAAAGGGGGGDWSEF